MIPRKAYLVDSVVDQVHLRIQSGIDVLEAEKVALLERLITVLPLEVWPAIWEYLLLLFALHLCGANE